MKNLLFPLFIFISLTSFAQQRQLQALVVKHHDHNITDSSTITYLNSTQGLLDENLFKFRTQINYFAHTQWNIAIPTFSNLFVNYSHPMNFVEVNKFNKYGASPYTQTDITNMTFGPHGRLTLSDTSLNNQSVMSRNEYSYNSDGQLIKHISFFGLNNLDTFMVKDYEYYTNGDLMQIQSIGYTNNQPVNDYRDSLVYTNGRISSDYLFTSSFTLPIHRYDYSYNNFGDLEVLNYYAWNGTPEMRWDGSHVLRFNGNTYTEYYMIEMENDLPSDTLFQYDFFGDSQIDSILTYDQSGNLYRKIKFEYEDVNFLSKMSFVDIDSNGNNGNQTDYHFFYNSPLLVQDLEMHQVLTPFPNPSSEVILFKDLKNGEVQVYNALGKLVLQANISSSGLNIGNLENGQYFFQVESREKMYQGKFVKN